MKRLFLQWFAAALAITLTAYIHPGIEVGSGFQGFLNALVGSLLLGFFNAILRPFLVFLSCPLVILSFGLFIFLINALILLWASSWTRAFGFFFYVDGLSAAITGSIMITILNFVFSKILVTNDRGKKNDQH